VSVVVAALSGTGTPGECRGLTGEELEVCEDASDAGTAIGVWLVVVLWAAVDVILGVGHLVHRLAGRRA
jgi:hypothetical protein